MSWAIHSSGGDRRLNEKETLGKYLKRERESKKISLREMAKNTRVREYLLKAIEEDRHDLLPSLLYVRGFLSSYAKFVGLDPQDVLNRYERSLKGEPITPPEVKLEKKVSGRPLSNLKQIGIVSGVIVLSILVSYFLYPYLSRSPVEPLPAKPGAGETQPAKPAVEESLPIVPTTQTQQVAAAVEVKPFTLDLRATEETWVRIRVDDRQTEALFKPGDGSSYRATNRIELLIGNAGGLDMAFNGKALEKFGKSGEVITLVFTPQGVERKKPEEGKSQ
jgi:cytoskeletal protein RodZ